MSCAIDPKLMAHQWRNWFAPLLKVALREKANGFGCAISFFPIAQHWRNSAPEQCPLAATGRQRRASRARDAIRGSRPFSVSTSGVRT
jgi:hypothetical protein